jgi:hypothetical protein
MKFLNYKMNLNPQVNNHKILINKNIFTKCNKNYKIFKEVLNKPKINTKVNRDKLKFYPH